MGGRGGSMGGSHGMGGGGGAAKAAPQTAPQTREQQLLAQIKGNPAALMQMSDADALDTVKAIESQAIARDHTQNDTFCQRWLNSTGLADEKPEVLDEKAYETARAYAGMPSLYHSDAPYDSNAATAVKTLKQLQTGQSAFASYGVHGSGTYLDPNAVYSARDYAGFNGSQVKMFLNDNARIAKWADLKQAEANFKVKHPKTYAHLTSQIRNLGDWGTEELKTVWLTSSGFNAYDCGAYQYKVAYSRKALTICTTIQSKQQVLHGGGNW